MSVTHGLSGSWLKPRAEATFSISIYIKENRKAAGKEVTCII